jgi:hypothetical protein
MSSEAKQKPRTNGKRNSGLTKAAATSTLAGPDTPLKPSTILRLEAIQDSYATQTTDLNTKKNNKVAATTVKTAKGSFLTTIVSHFLQVFILGVVRKVFPNAALSFFGLDVINPTLPPLSTDAEIADVSKLIGTGDTERMAGTGFPVAMAMPTAAQVATARAEFIIASNDKDAAETAFKASAEALNAMNIEADEVLNLVNGEVDATTVNMSAGAARDVGRLWGFVYVKVGSPKRLTGIVTDIVTGKAIEDADVQLDNGTNEDTTGVDGLYELNTTLMSVQLLLATHPLYADFAQDVTFVENQNLVYEIKMTPL